MIKYSLPFELWLEIISYNNDENKLIFMLDKSYLNNIKLDEYTTFYLNNKNNLMKNLKYNWYDRYNRTIFKWREKLPLNRDNIDWFNLSINPNSITILENLYAINILEENMSKIIW